MPKRERVLGTIQIVLLHLISENKSTDSSGHSLQEELVQIVDHPVSKAQVSTALRRLKERKLLTSKRASLSGRRGKPRQLYSLTDTGYEALMQYQKIAAFVTKISPAE